MASLFRTWNELNLGRHKAEFYRMWRAGYGAGLPNAQVFAQMGDFSRSPTVRRLREVMLEGVERRLTVRDTIRGHPELLIPFESATLELGEESGRLEDVLGLLGDYFTAEHRMMMWVKRKLAYPMTTTVTAIFIAPFPILFFGDIQLYVVVVVSELVAVLLLGGTVLAAAARWFGRRARFVVGRFCRALTLGIEAGLSLDRVTELAVAAAAHPELTRHLNRVPRRQRAGQPLSKTFAGTTMLPPNVVAALEVAEASGDYGGTVRKLAELYDGGYA